MFVKEFGKKITSRDLNTQLEGVYKWKLNLSEMTQSDAMSTLNRVSGKIRTIKNSSLGHQAERNPGFMEAMLVSQVLETWLNEHAQMLAERKLSPSEIKKREKYADGMKKVEEDFKKRYGANAHSVMEATARKMAKKKSVAEAMDLLKSVLVGRSQLNEGEVDQASAIVAARGMVDEIQKMLEKIGKMVNEELPSLMDTIRDRVGQEQASAFGQAASSSLTPLMDAVKAAREQMDSAARTVAGEEASPMGGLGGMGGDLGAGAPVGADLGADAGGIGDLGGDAAPEIPRAGASEFDSSDAAVGGTAELGRGKR